MSESMVSVSEVNGVPVVRMDGTKSDPEALAALQDLLQAVTAGGHDHVVFDGCKLSAVDDTLLGTLTVLASALRDRGGQLRVCFSSRTTAKELWNELDLAAYMPLHDSVKDAVGAVGG